jgi:hypothetical protein
LEASTGLFDTLLGNASEVNTQRLESEFAMLLISGEQIEHAYRLFRPSKGTSSNIAIHNAKVWWPFSERKES